MSSKPVGFQDITSNVLGYTINTSTAQCRLVERQIADLPQATQDEIYGRFHAVCNRGDKDADKGRKFLYTSLDYAGLSQQLGKVATDITNCIKILQLFAQNASIDSVYPSLSDFAKKEIEAHGSQRQAAVAAYVDKLDPLPTAPANAASPAASTNSAPSTASEENIIAFAKMFRSDFNTLNLNKDFLSASVQDSAHAQETERLLKILDELSPFAQLLVEREIIGLPFHRKPAVTALNITQVTADTMRALPKSCHPQPVKQAMLTLFKSFEANVVDLTVTSDMKLEKLGLTEQLLLRQYLGLPRNLAHAYLASYPNCYSAELAVHVSENIPSSSASSALKDFESADAKIKQIGSECDQEYRKNYANVIEDLTSVFNFAKTQTDSLDLKSRPRISAKLQQTLEKIMNETFDRATGQELMDACKQFERELLQTFYIQKKLYTKKDFLAQVEKLSFVTADSPSSANVSQEMNLHFRGGVWEWQSATKDLILQIAKYLRQDINNANDNLMLLETHRYAMSNNENPQQVYEKLVVDIYKGFSHGARSIIYKIAMNRAEPPATTDIIVESNLHVAICHFFKKYFGVPPKMDAIMSDLKLNRAEAVDACIYLQASVDFYTLLPTYGTRKFTVSEDEFIKQAKALLPNIDFAKYDWQNVGKPSTTNSN